jgi:hypothetical protein
MYGMMGMRMGGMGMMGMGGMGMMGMSGMGGMGMGMGMMGGGGTQQPAPKIEHPPGLQREDHIQLGTNFVSRLEVRSQPVVQVCSTGTFHPPSSSRHTPGRSPPRPILQLFGAPDQRAATDQGLLDAADGADRIRGERGVTAHGY